MTGLTQGGLVTLQRGADGYVTLHWGVLSWETPVSKQVLEELIADHNLLLVYRAVYEPSGTPDGILTK